MARKPAPPTRIQKAGSGHSYFLDGVKVPGVTTILGNGVPKNGLQGWAAGTVADFVVNRLAVARGSDGRARIVADELVADALSWNATRERPTAVSPGEVLPRSALVEILKNIRYRDLGEASAKGTDVHRIAERLGRGEEVDVPEHLTGYVDGYLRFLDEWQPRDALLEAVVINRKWRYMGKSDLIAEFDELPAELAEMIGKSSGRGLLDLKTSRSAIFPEVGLQLVGYKNAETILLDGEEQPMPPIDFVAAVHVKPDGDYEVIAFDLEERTRPTTFDVFLYVKMVGEWLDWKEGPSSTIRRTIPRPRRDQ